MWESQFVIWQFGLSSDANCPCSCGFGTDISFAELRKGCHFKKFADCAFLLVAVVFFLKKNVWNLVERPIETSDFNVRICDVNAAINF